MPVRHARSEAIRPALRGEPVTTQFVDDSFHQLTAARRFNAGLMATFGLVAIAIGAVGVYGTTTFFVSQRVRTIGLCMSLGAAPVDIVKSLLAGALLRVGLGTAIGLAGAWAISGGLESLVFGIRPTNTAVFVGVAASVTLVGLAAAAVPAVRAALVDPSTILRHE